MDTRRLGRLGHDSSVLIYGAAALAEVTQATAEESLDSALAAGINHFDVAASYGEAELRMGPWVEEHRAEIFLASKTGDRSADSAWTSINRSLELLHADRLDLIQAHAVTSMEELDEITAPGGAVEALVRARDEGLVSAIGITGHSHAAPRVHTEALRRVDFDSVLTPLNHLLWHRIPGYADDYTALVEAVQARDTALMTIKAVARRLWPAEKRYATWYEPFEEQQLVTAAVTWVLKGHPEVTGIATAGETQLLARMVEAERADMSLEEADSILARLSDEQYSSPFAEMPG